MVKLNLPFSDQAPVPVIQNPQSDPNRLTSYANATTQGLNQMLDTAYGQAESFRQQAQRAEALAVEARNNADLSKLAPAAMKGIGDAMTNTANALLAIDQQQYERELPLKEKAYLLEGTYNTQTEYMALKSKLAESRDPKALEKLQSFVHNNAMSYLSKAPSEDAKLDMLGKFTKFKLAAYEDGLSIQHSAARARVNSQLNNASGAVLKSVRENPENIVAHLTQMQQVASVYKETGASPQAVKQYEDTLTKKIYSESVGSLLNKGSTAGALAMLGKDEVRKNLAPGDYESLVDKTAQQALRETVGAKFNLQEQIGYRNYLQGNIGPDMKNASKYADIGFLQFKTTLGSNDGTNKENWNQVSQNITNWFSQNNKVMGKQSTSYLVNNALDDTNIPNALAHSSVLDNIFNNKLSPASKLASQLLKNADDKQLGGALQFSRLVRGGVAPEVALKSVKDSLSEVLTPEQKTQRRNDWNKFWKDNDPKDVAWSHFDTWWPGEKEPVNLPMYADELKKTTQDYFQVTKDMNTALTMAEAKLKDKFHMTDINGRKEIMESAPELYTDNIDKFKESLVKNVIADLANKGYEVDGKNFTAKKNDVIMELGIQPIYNYTVNQKGSKTYYVVDKKTDMPLMDDSGNYVVFNYGVNLSKYKSERDMIIDGFKQQRLEYPTKDYIHKQATKQLIESGALKDMTPEQREKIFANMKKLQNQYPDIE